MVPAAGVYFVKFCSSARTAACLMLSGVGKSGSPAPKSTTSTPSRRSLSASAATFMVEDTLIAEIRCAISCFTSSCIFRRYPFLLFLLQNPFAEPDVYRRRHQPRNVAAQADHFLYQPRTDERIRFTRHHEDGLHGRVET